MRERRDDPAVRTTWTNDELDGLGRSEELELRSIVAPESPAATFTLVPR
jgi:hypothetical protein